MVVWREFLRTAHRTLFWILLLFLPTQLGLHVWPAWSFVLGRRIDYLSPTVHFTDILLFSLLCCWVVESVTNGLKRPAFSATGVRHATAYVIVGSVFIALNIWGSSSPYATVFAWIKFFEMVCFALYVRFAKPDMRTVLVILSVSISYESIIAISQFALQRSLGGPFWLLGERLFSAQTPGIAQVPLCLPFASGCPLKLRSYATFPHPNVLGGYVVVLMPLLIFQLRQSLRKQERLLLAGAIVLGVCALAASFSRNAWIVLIVLFLISFGKTALTLQTKWAKAAVLGVFTLFVCVILFVSLTIHGSDESVRERTQLAVSSVRMSVGRPWMGVGLGNFLIALPRFLPQRSVYVLQPVHSIYLLVLTETGVIGLAAFSYALVFLLYGQMRAVIVTSSIRNLSYRNMVAVSLLGLLLLGVFDHYPLTLQQGRLLFSLLFGLLLIQGKN